MDKKFYVESKCHYHHKEHTIITDMRKDTKLDTTYHLEFRAS